MNKLLRKTYKNIKMSKLAAFTVGLALSLGTSQAAFAQVNIASVPLFLKESVDPNLMFVFDDSGSMAWRFMPDSLNGESYGYWYYSSYVNKIYYDPTVTYLPRISPTEADGTPTLIIMMPGSTASITLMVRIT
ncbi:hypothetical protein ACFQGA_17145 [Marinobacter koreensis]|uniref:hypothetical protein n=1 Tax=Marinobacter koreensis TaxID=335974 RepID=UPI00361C4E1A